MNIIDRYKLFRNKLKSGRTDIGTYKHTSSIYRGHGLPKSVVKEINNSVLGNKEEEVLGI